MYCTRGAAALQSIAEQKKAFMLSWHNEAFARNRSRAALPNGYSVGRPPMDADILPSRPPTVCLTAADDAAAHPVERRRARAPAPTPAPTRPRSRSTTPSGADAGALMRVNHVGEVCAQALYTRRRWPPPNPALRRQFAARGARGNRPPGLDRRAPGRARRPPEPAQPALVRRAPSASAWSPAGRRRVSLGFVVETERQVEQHLESHLDRLPAADPASRAIVEQMKDDEAGAREAGRAAPARARCRRRCAGRCAPRRRS